MKENNLITQNSSNQEKTNDTEPLEYLIKEKNNKNNLSNNNLFLKKKKIPLPIITNFENPLKKYEIQYGIDDNGNPMDIKDYYKNINTNTSNLSKSRISGTSTTREPKPVAFIIKDKNTNDNILIDLNGNPILNKNKDGDYEYPLKLNILIKNFDVQHPELRINGERNNKNKNELFLLDEEVITNTNENILPIDSNPNEEFSSCNNENKINEKNIINLWKARYGNYKLNESKSFNQINYVIKKKKKFIERNNSSQCMCYKEKINNIPRNYSNNNVNIKLYNKNYEIMARTNSILNKNKKILKNLEINKRKNYNTEISRILTPKINCLFNSKNNTMCYNLNDKQQTTSFIGFKNILNSNINTEYLNSSMNKKSTKYNFIGYKSALISPKDLLNRVKQAESFPISNNFNSYKKINKTKIQKDMVINDENKNHLNKVEVLKNDICNKKKEFNFKKIPIYPKKIKRKVIKCSVLTKEADSMVKNFNSKKETYNLKYKKVNDTFNKISSVSCLLDRNKKLLGCNTSSFDPNYQKSSILLFKKQAKINRNKVIPRASQENKDFRIYLKNLEYKNKNFFM